MKMLTHFKDVFGISGDLNHLTENVEFGLRRMDKNIDDGFKRVDRWMTIFVVGASYLFS